MNEDIYDSINNTLTYLDKLSIPRKIVRDVLHATEFNAVVDKINEIKDYLNGPTRDVIHSTTAYIIEKINTTQQYLNGGTIPVEEGSSTSILTELTNIKNRLSATESRSVSNATDIVSINSNLDSIAQSMGIMTSKVNELEESVNTSYENAVNAANKYTDDAVNTAYNILDTRVTTINDTTLTFEYDIRTDPEPQVDKLIYDNDEDLYDGEYHD